MRQMIDLEIRNGDLSSALSLMQAHGSSVVLNYGEDNDAWECSWIVEGRRITDFGRNADVAVCRVLARIRDALTAREAATREGEP